MRDIRHEIENKNFDNFYKNFFANDFQNDKEE
jgi:queuine/archaeosine tRNA-ribosyltransferase